MPIFFEAFREARLFAAITVFPSFCLLLIPVLFLLFQIQFYKLNIKNKIAITD